MKVPFADLYAQYFSIKTEIDRAICAVIETSSFIRGQFVEDFEKQFSATVGAKHCISCANGTDSLEIAMHALDLALGGEVITTAHSWISTSEAITQAGGTVVFCDTESGFYTIDPEAIERAITPRTVGIIPVHLYGMPANMPEIMKIAKKHKLWVIEDCAQAHLARINGVMVGSFGDIASYSFYPGKNLGAMGDAGALTTNDPDLANKMARYARHGGLIKGDHQIEGINSRLDGIQAAILSVKLPHLDAWTKRRREVADTYFRHLSGVKPLVLPPIISGYENVFHLFVIKLERRDELANYLNEMGVQTSINYPVALPFLPAYSKLNHKYSDFPNAFNNQSRILSLPIYPEMNSGQIHYVTNCIKNFFDA